MVHLEHARECEYILLELMKEFSNVQEFLKKITKRVLMDMKDLNRKLY